MLELGALVASERGELLASLGQHLFLTGASVLAAVVVGVPLAVRAARSPRAEGVILGTASGLQTVPSLALLALLMVALGAAPALPGIGKLHAIGSTPALIALTAYALLPILRTTVTALREIPEAAVEAAEGLGMTPWQRLRLVELPLALPTIIAGLRTATVVGVGVATLGAFVGAGGLGTFINRGLYMNQQGLILLGAVPAALLALALDQFLAFAEAIARRGPGQRRRRLSAALWLGASWTPLLAFVFLVAAARDGSSQAALPAVPLRAGFTSEFIERPDGAKGLESRYGFRFAQTLDMEASLMYRALASGQVDVVSAYSTDGRIPALGLRLLRDDRGFFPPYEAAPVLRRDAAARAPGLELELDRLAGRLSAETMQRLNFEVDERKRSIPSVAREFLSGQGLLGSRRPAKDGRALVAASKSFTESTLLAEMLAQLAETRLGLRVERRFNLGGTMIVHQALVQGAIDVYPEYTGTALTTVLGRERAASPREAFNIVSREYRERFDCLWLEPLGFNNSYALAVRGRDAADRGWSAISDLTGLRGSR